MALNLKKDNNDRLVPNCSSDESGSDCSSEELIDCDVIVDVTTVATQIDECKTNLQRLDGKQIDDDTLNKKTKNKSNAVVETLIKGNEILNMKDGISKISQAGETKRESSDKFCPKISQNSDSKQIKPNTVNHKKRKVNFNLTIDIAKQPLSRDRDSGEQCVPQCSQTFGGPGSVDFTDIESLSEPIPTTPGGKPQVNTFDICQYKFL